MYYVATRTKPRSSLLLRSYVLRRVALCITSLFDQTEGTQDTQLLHVKTPDLASSRRADEFHVSQVK